MLNPFANRKLLRRGEAARARIVEMAKPEPGENPSKVEMTLTVDFRGVPLEVQDRWMVSGTEPIGKGSAIWVVVDPEKRHRVAIDWERTRAEYRERTDVRRRVLGTGLPVPVTKVRDALLEAEAEGNGLTPAAEATGIADPDPSPPEVEPAAEPEEQAPPQLHAPEPSAALPDGPPDPLAGLSLHERDLLAQHPPMPAAPPVQAPAGPVASAPAQPLVAEPPPVVAPPVPAPAPAAADDDDLTSKLERLAGLNAAGALTDGEFSAAKAHVLSSC